MIMAWRVAESLKTLRKQVDQKWPGRSIAADGTIGDAAHSSRKSDHNPWVKDGAQGVVTAIDITHDPGHGLNSRKLAEALIASRDPRIKYIISNGQICSGANQQQKAWVWRPYSGSNPHTKHVHLSVHSSKELYDSTVAWGLDATPVMIVESAVPVETAVTSRPVLSKGSRGEDVREVQDILDLEADGVFGIATENAVKKFQRENKLAADGRVGPYTWAALIQARPI